MKKFQKLGLIFLISLFLLILDSFGIFGGAKRLVIRLFGERRAEVYQKIIGPTEESEKLRRELTSCQSKIFELEEENFQARRLLDAGFKPETGVVLAKVVGSSNNRLLINVSGKEKIKQGASVIIDRVVLGKVEETDGLNAKVILLNSVEIKIPVKIWLNEMDLKGNNSALAEGILTGDGEKIIVKEILASEEVKKNDLVGLVVETGEVFLVGKVKTVFPAGDKIFQEAEIDWSADPGNLLTVGVIK